MSDVGTTIPDETQEASAPGGYTPVGGPMSDGDTGTGENFYVQSETISRTVEIGGVASSAVRIYVSCSLIDEVSIDANTQNGGTINVAAINGEPPQNQWVEYQHESSSVESITLSFTESGGSNVYVDIGEVQPHLPDTGPHVHEN